MGMTGTTWGGDHRDNGDHSHGDLLGAVGMMGMTQGQCGDDRDDVGMMGTTGTTWGGDHRDHSHGDHMGTFWGLWGQCVDDRDDMGMTGTTWGPWEQQNH